MCLGVAESQVRLAAFAGGWMAFGRTIRRKARAAIPLAVFMALIGYFISNAAQGDRGLQGLPQRRLELQQAQAGQENASAEAAVWERRVTGLLSRLDIDALDERARAQLDLSDPNDVIVQYDKGRKLF